MQSSDVTLSERASAICLRDGIAEHDVKLARAAAASEYEGREFLIVVGDLPDGRAVRMSCPFDRMHHVQTFRLLP